MQKENLRKKISFLLWNFFICPKGGPTVYLYVQCIRQYYYYNADENEKRNVTLHYTVSNHYAHRGKSSINSHKKYRLPNRKLPFIKQRYLHYVKRGVILYFSDQVKQQKRIICNDDRKLSWVSTRLWSIQRRQKIILWNQFDIYCRIVATQARMRLTQRPL